MDTQEEGSDNNFNNDSVAAATKRLKERTGKTAFSMTEVWQEIQNAG